MLKTWSKKIKLFKKILMSIFFAEIFYQGFIKFIQITRLK